MLHFIFDTGQQYTPKMRTLVYSLLNGYTSSGKMKQVISDISQVTGMDVKDEDIPSRRTIERMQLELGVISDLQVILKNIIYSYESMWYCFIFYQPYHLYNSIIILVP